MVKSYRYWVVFHARRSSKTILGLQRRGKMKKKIDILNISNTIRLIEGIKNRISFHSLSYLSRPLSKADDVSGQKEINNVPLLVPTEC